MKQFDYIIKDPDGINAEPAVLLGKKVKEFEGTKVTVSKGESSTLATKLLGIIGLDAHCGDRITFTCEGGDEEGAALALQQLVSDYL